MKLIIIQTTYPNTKTATELAKILLDKKLAACINFSTIVSLYEWEGKIIEGKEILLNIKTRDNLYKKVEAEIKKHHSYKLPEIIAFEIKNGCKNYLNWIEKQTIHKKS